MAMQWLKNLIRRLRSNKRRDNSMQFELTVDPTAISYLIDIEGLPPGTNATIAVSETNAEGTGPATTLPLTVAAAPVSAPGAPVIVEVQPPAAAAQVAQSSTAAPEQAVDQAAATSEGGSTAGAGN